MRLFAQVVRQFFDLSQSHDGGAFPRGESPSIPPVGFMRIYAVCDSILVGRLTFAEARRMSTATTSRATIDDLLRVEGKTGLIGGRLVDLMRSGCLPNRVGLKIARLLDDHAEATGIGVACTGSLIFAVHELPSGRESFSPDAAYYVGPLPKKPMRPIEGPPTLAIEVRSEGDYGPAAERAMAAKRADYFAAGTLVVWDVDPVAEPVHVYRASSPDIPSSYGRGQRAEAESALPGWNPPIDDFFPSRCPPYFAAQCSLSATARK